MTTTTDDSTWYPWGHIGVDDTWREHVGDQLLGGYATLQQVPRDHGDT